METYTKFNPITVLEEEQLQQQLHGCGKYGKKSFIPQRHTKKCQGLCRPDCFTQYPKHFQQEECDFSETSSSSSSSSDSEEEFNPTVMTKRTTIPKTMWRRQQQLETPRVWFTIVDLEGFSLHDVTVKLNPKCRVLVIKATNTKTLQQEEQMFVEEEDVEQQQTFGGKCVRVIPLPENVHLEQLRVQMTTRGQLVVKAPFLMPGESLWQQKQLHRFTPTWVPIRVTLKNSTIKGLFNKTHYQCDINTVCPTGYPLMEEENMFPCQEQQWNKMNKNITGRGLFQTSTGISQNLFPCQGQQWNKVNKNITGRGLFQTSTGISQFLRPQYIRDEVTGKLAMIINVNTVGFRPEEICVCVKEGILIVEATKRSATATHIISQIPKLGLPVKYLHREFILPQFLDVTHIAYRVLSNGIVTIKLPMLKNKGNINNIFNMQQKTQPICGECNVEKPCRDVMSWEKPMWI
jgi:HSP20 family molecular chaperone IbpA